MHTDTTDVQLSTLRLSNNFERVLKILNKKAAEYAPFHNHISNSLDATHMIFIESVLAYLSEDSTVAVAVREEAVRQVVNDLEIEKLESSILGHNYIRDNRAKNDRIYRMIEDLEEQHAISLPLPHLLDTHQYSLEQYKQVVVADVHKQVTPEKAGAIVRYLNNHMFGGIADQIHHFQFTDRAPQAHSFCAELIAQANSKIEQLLTAERAVHRRLLGSTVSIV